MKNDLSTVANTKFERLSTRLSNAEILRDLVKRVFLRENVIACFKNHNEDNIGINWWQDVELMSVFKNMYTAGVLPLPFDAVERIRWIALICVQICIREGFNYGNILYALDYIPTEDLTDEYGVRITEQIVNLRRELAKNGWEFVFKWNGSK